MFGIGLSQKLFAKVSCDLKEMLGDYAENYLIPQQVDDEFAHVENFKDYVQAVEAKRHSNNIKSITYGVTKFNQKYAIVHTEAVKIDNNIKSKNQVTVYMDEDHRNQPKMSVYRNDAERQNYPYVELKTFKLKKDAVRMVYERMQDLVGENLGVVYPHLKPRIRVMPKECVIIPDDYLAPGDHLQTDFIAIAKDTIASHEGIYIGEDQVCHVSGHGDGKFGSKARLGSLNGDFCHDEEDEIRVAVHRVRTKDPRDIVNTAIRLAAENFREGEYHLLGTNCQHYANYCARGIEDSIDAHHLETALNNIVKSFKSCVGWNSFLPSEEDSDE